MRKRRDHGHGQSRDGVGSITGGGVALTGCGGSQDQTDATGAVQDATQWQDTTVQGAAVQTFAATSNWFAAATLSQRGSDVRVTASDGSQSWSYGAGDTLWHVESVALLGTRCFS